ncbi:hypothetical protein WDW86_10930 [Bdellovibrionota bacterium FG-2]
MPFDSDFALFGTGVAPLVAASHLLAQGKSVVVINPDRDFFLEDSELPLDPMLPLTCGRFPVGFPERLKRNTIEKTLATLRPDFPGAIEGWFGSEERRAERRSEKRDERRGQGFQGFQGFHDTSAPHVRSRGFEWVVSETPRGLAQGDFDELFLGFSDAGLNPQLWEKLQAARRFPGGAAGAKQLQGLFVPRLCDVDVARYRNGLLEFVRERLGGESFFSSAGQFEITQGGVRFTVNSEPKSFKINEGLLVFWTPKLTSWILKHAKKFGMTPVLPLGLRLWEQWSVISRESLDSSCVGVFEDMAVWAESEGAPNLEEGLYRLAILKAGARVGLQAAELRDVGSSWVSEDSLGVLTSLCHDFLKWERFTLRSMKARALLEWGDEKTWPLLATRSSNDLKVRVVNASDGPLVDVVRVARASVMEGGV